MWACEEYATEPVSPQQAPAEVLSEGENSMANTCISVSTSRQTSTATSEICNFVQKVARLFPWTTLLWGIFREDRMGKSAADGTLQYADLTLLRFVFYCLLDGNVERTAESDNCGFR